MYFFLRFLPLLTFVLFLSCQDMTPPTISIKSPSNHSTVYEVVTLSVDVNDNESISRVEFYLNDLLIFTDNEYPYEYLWNTTEYDNGSNHTIKVIAYDNSDNSTSKELILTVDNSSAVPNGGNVISVSYTLTEMIIEWEPSIDDDFYKYTIMSAEIEDGEKQSLATYNEISSSSHSISEFNPTIENWFYVQVEDTFGLTNIGSGMTNDIDLEPNSVDVISVEYDLNLMTISWEAYLPNFNRILEMNQNYGNNVINDFASYDLLLLDNKFESYVLLATITDQSITSHSLTDYDPTKENWFRVRITDFWGLNSTGNEMTNGIDLEPNSVDVVSVEYDSDSMTISWEQSIDDDFWSYELLKSESELGIYNSVATIMDQSTTSFSLTNYNPNEENWFKIRVTDFWGLNSLGNGMSNERNNPPSPSDLVGILYNDDSFMITWSQSNDSDFNSYKLYESSSSNINEFTLIYETELITDTTHTVLGINYGDKRYYKVETLDAFGLKAESESAVGVTYLFQANFTNDWLCPDCGIGIIFLSRMDGSFVGSNTWEGNASFDVSIPDQLLLIPDTISVTTIASGQLLTEMNIPIGSSWTWGKEYPDYPNFDNYETLDLYFTNIPDHDGYNCSGPWSRYFDSILPDTLEFTLFAPPTDIYLKLNTSNFGVQYIFINDIHGGSHTQDLLSLNNADQFIIDLNDNSQRLRKFLYGHPNSENRYAGRYTIDFENNNDTTVNAISVYYPPQTFIDYRTSLFIYENNNDFWYQSVYGDIPSEFVKIDGDFEFWNTNPTDFKLEINGSNFDQIESYWVSNDDYNNLNWYIYGPSNLNEYTIPEIPEKVSEFYPELNRDSYDLYGVRTFDWPELDSYYDGLDLFYKSSELFYNVVNEIRFRLKYNPQRSVPKISNKLLNKTLNLEKELFPGDRMHLHYQKIKGKDQKY